MIILAIETSCDETAAAVSDGPIVRSNVISSQIALHQTHGGVVPELAARGHITAIIPVVEAALAEAGVERSAVDAVAVTVGPGLAGALLVGVNAANALAFGLERPLIPVNHLEAHLYANWVQPADQAEWTAPAFPALCLLVSGGHSELILMTDHLRYQHLGRTLDDAAGEAFDKGARLLGLGYPGGPAIQRASEGGNAAAFDLPRAWLGGSLDFSFSGLKTALLRIVEPYRLPDEGGPKVSALGFAVHRPPRYSERLPLADLAASYQAAIVDVLAVKTAEAAVQHGARSVLLAGGVAANRVLRERLARELSKRSLVNVDFRYPPFELCTDNAAMIAVAAHYRAAVPNKIEIDIYPRLPLAAMDRELGLANA